MAGAGSNNSLRSRGANNMTATIAVSPTTEYADPDPRVCTVCGVRQCGQHLNLYECITALREVIAMLQLRIEQLLETNLEHGTVNRSNNRFVLLNGERMCLSDAARKLNLSLDALRWRIKTRLGEITDTVDLREIGIADRHYARPNETGNPEGEACAQ